jgi:hypothetical protein
VSRPRKHRRVPNAISKRLRRKLRRARNPYLLWLRCRRPALYARLQRWWTYKLIDYVTSVPPYATPLFSFAVKGTPNMWRLDPA